MCGGLAHRVHGHPAEQAAIKETDSLSQVLVRQTVDVDDEGKREREQCDGSISDSK